MSYTFDTFSILLHVLTSICAIDIGLKLGRVTRGQRIDLVSYSLSVLLMVVCFYLLYF